MKKLIIITGVLVAIFLASAVFVTSCTGKKSEQEQTEGDGHQHAEGEEHEGMEMDSTEMHDMDSTQMAYACPMHPEVTGKEGDKCSKCGMKLEPVKEHKDDHEH